MSKKMFQKIILTPLTVKVLYKTHKLLKGATFANRLVFKRNRKSNEMKKVVEDNTV